MGILNVTPDSFSDGARFNQFDQALAHAEEMIEQGADIIDIGGESTRPGAKAVSESEEIKRVIPLVERVSRLGVPVSVDTSKPGVMRASAEAGAGMINDVRALTEPGALAVVSEIKLPVCLMHMQGQPRTMQHNPSYQDVVSEVKGFLRERIAACVNAGIDTSLIAIDPGFGFGKTLPHNLELLTQLSCFNDLNVPILAGLSRKSMLGQITGRDVNDRLAASLAVALIAMQQGAKIIRVHDVKQTSDVKKIFIATNTAELI
ncbi:dihydropteroate synthase [Aliikangiella coralliicola]|uniref:Dihydropteroate synthase n=2 Tax=Aliikangiella coralliicola TaxID=2592383 RepID=A0A545UI03_9GAMM|nr:dihydropteroate synthase [Aliikangiella coralliicola]